MDEEYDCIVLGTGLTVFTKFFRFIEDSEILSTYFLFSRNVSFLECYPSVERKFCISIGIITTEARALRLLR